VYTEAPPATSQQQQRNDQQAADLQPAQNEEERVLTKAEVAKQQKNFRNQMPSSTDLLLKDSSVSEEAANPAGMPLEKVEEVPASHKGQSVPVPAAVTKFQMSNVTYAAEAQQPPQIIESSFQQENTGFLQVNNPTSQALNQTMNQDKQG